VLSYAGGVYILFSPLNYNINQRIPIDISLPISDSNHDTVRGIKQIRNSWLAAFYIIALKNT